MKLISFQKAVNNCENDYEADLGKFPWLVDQWPVLETTAKGRSVVLARLEVSRMPGYATAAEVCVGRRDWDFLPRHVPSHPIACGSRLATVEPPSFWHCVANWLVWYPDTQGSPHSPKTSGLRRSLASPCDGPWA